MTNKFFIGEYCELDYEIYVLARVSTFEWNLISVNSGQPYLEIPFKDLDRMWWEEFTIEELSNHFQIEFTESSPGSKVRVAKKLAEGQDFWVRVKDLSGERYRV